MTAKDRERQREHGLGTLSGAVLTLRRIGMTNAEIRAEVTKSLREADQLYPPEKRKPKP